MKTYLVECYWPGVDEQRFTLAVERLGAANGLAVSWTISILVPEDEIVLCLASGPSVEAVQESARRAGVTAERIVPCFGLVSGDAALVSSEERRLPDDRSVPSLVRSTSNRKEQH